MPTTPTTIDRWMTVAPYTIGTEVTVEAARRVMDDFRVGHLPVRDEGRLVGVISSADVQGAPFRLVSEVMHREPLVVDPGSPASDVARAMAERHADVAIVVSGERVVGIFTATDAERLLSSVLDGLEHGRH
ncbi:MAG: CBS domain-containing protein [Deltaproteobacteria bacterium]|nr:CBS domain-containing protein [Deltaproteobacteria bacterium]